MTEFLHFYLDKVDHVTIQTLPIETQQITILIYTIAIDLTRPGLEPKIYHTPGEHATHNTRGSSLYNCYKTRNYSTFIQVVQTLTSRKFKHSSHE